MPEDTTLALFGATGNIGTELLKALRNTATERSKILVFTRGDPATTQSKFELDGRFECLSLPYVDDVLNTEALITILKSYTLQTSFVCIPQKSVDQGPQFVDPIATALKQAGIVRVIKVGTGVPDKYEYGRRHLKAEQLIRDKGLKLTVLQAGDISTNPHWLGPSPPGAPYALHDVFKALSYLSFFGFLFRSMGTCVDMIGGGRTPFMDLRDYGEALAVVLLDPAKHDGKTYRIVSTPHVRISDIAREYGKLLNRTIYVVNPTEEDKRMLLGMEGYKGTMADIIIEMFDRFSEGIYDYDSDDFTKLTGRPPRTLTDFCKEKVQANGKPISLW